VKREINLMVDPQPSWMAIVNHGANQTPWSVVKSDQPADTESNQMATINKGKGSAKKSVVTKLTFTKGQFPNEGDVTSFMQKNEFADYEIVDEGDVWTAKSTEDFSNLELDKARATATKTTGVTAFVAEVKAEKAAPADDNDEDDKKPEAKAASKVKAVDGEETNVRRDAGTADYVLKFPERTVKYDFWGAMMSNEGNLFGVLKDGQDYDGVPPGMMEVLDAVYFTASNILTSDDANKEASLKQLGSDFAEITFGLYELFQKIEGGAAEEDTTKAIKALKVPEAKQEALIKWAASFKDAITKGTLGDGEAFGGAMISDGGAANVIIDGAVGTDDDKNGDDGNDNTIPGPNSGEGANGLLAGTVADQKSATKKGGDEAPAWAQGLIKSVGEVAKQVSGLTTRLEAVETTAKAAELTAAEAAKTADEVGNRSTSRKSLASAADDFAASGDGNETEVAKQEQARRDARAEEVRRSFGVASAYTPKTAARR
jgi:hypothetical protein